MKLEQDELKKSEARFRALFENAVDAIFIADAEGIHTDVNTSGCRLLGYEREELIGKAIVDILQPEEIPRFLAARDSLLEGKTHFEEWTLIRKDGSLVAVEISAKMLPDGSLQAFVRDITERKRAEELRKRQSSCATLRADVQAAISSGGNSLQSNMESIVRHLDAAFARVWIIDEKEDLILYASAGLCTQVDGGCPGGLVGQAKIGVVPAQKTLVFSNSITDFDQIDKGWAEHEGLVSLAGFPLIFNDNVVGVTEIFSRHKLTKDVLEAFESITAIIAQGVVRKYAEDLLRSCLKTWSR